MVTCVHPPDLNVKPGLAVHRITAALALAVCCAAASCAPAGLPYPWWLDADLPDSGPTDLGTDTGTDLGVDTGTDVGTDTGTDTGTDMGTDAGCNVLACSDGIDCTIDSCMPGVCFNTLAPGFCLIGGQCFVDGTLNPTNPCQLCDAAASGTSWTNHTMACDDGDLCTFNDACGGGSCGGTPYTCPPDMMTCTTAVCLGDGSCAQQIDPLLCGLIHGVARNASTRVPVVGATVNLRAAGTCSLGGGGPAIATETTNSLGKYFFLDIGAGNYCVDVSGGAGVQNMMSEDFPFQADEIRLVSFGMPPTGSSIDYTTVCGRVTDNTGTFLGGATVNLIANDSGNLGIVLSDESSDFGNYCIVGAPMESVFGTPFSDWAMSALRAGHLLAAVPPGGITPLDQITIFADWGLIPSPTLPVCFADGFETDTGWVPDPPLNGVSWNRRTNAITPNVNVPMCVSLPAENEDCAPDPMDPEDECAICVVPGASGCIPAPGHITNAFEGSWMHWFGEPASGSFLGSAGVCTVDNGGQSANPYDSSLVSPPIDLSMASDAVLRFAAWWEIESVDPASNQFDVMTVYAAADPMDFASTPGCGGNLDCTTCPLCLGILNPPFDRDGASEEPFSSGGFQAAPVWHLYEFDLSSWAGGTVHVRFRFESIDNQFNGFRGLAIDSMSILGSGC